jgi:hypothetical protein
MPLPGAVISACPGQQVQHRDFIIHPFLYQRHAMISLGENDIHRAVHPESLGEKVDLCQGHPTTFEGKRRIIGRLSGLIPRVVKLLGTAVQK